MRTARYSLITMRPDIERIDVLCIGAAVLSNGEWTILTLTAPAKLRALNANFPMARLVAIAVNLESAFGECVSLQEARVVLSATGSSVQMHAFEGEFSFESDDEFASQIRLMMAESVEPISAPQSVQTRRVRVGAHIRTRVRRQFEQMGIMGHGVADIDDHKVVRNYPVSAQHGLVAEFALRNGVMHFTETVDFDVVEEGMRGKKFEAQAKCLVLRAAVDTFGATTACHIVVSGADTAVANRSVDLLSTVGNLYDLNNPADMASYFDAMSRAAGITGQLRPI